MFIGPSRARIGRIGLMICLLWPVCSHAAMQLGRTRLIVSEPVPRAVIEAQNKDRVPLLLQAWIATQEDEGQAAQPQDLPLMVDPPVARLEPEQARTLQLLVTRQPKQLPVDRESLFWLNVLEVPMVDDPRAGEQAQLLMTVQSRLKVFYRPAAIAAVSPAQLGEDGRLHFRVERDTAQQWWLHIHNPAPIHQTLDHIKLTPATEGASPLVLPDPPMLAPFATQRLALPTVFNPNRARWRLAFAVLDDNGNPLENVQLLEGMRMEGNPTR